MHVILKVLVDDLEKLAQGARIEIHSNVFLELDLKEGRDGERAREVVRRIHKSAPKKYKECPNCRGKSFVNDRCCAKCEGTGRILVRPNIFIGDEIRIKDFIMQAWGRIKYPRPMGRNDVMNIPGDSLGIVVGVTDGEDPNFTVDIVLEGKLYRMLIEGQYIQALEVEEEGE